MNGDTVQKEHKPSDSLTDDQRKLLSQAIELIKQEVFADVTKRLRNYLLVAATLITAFGVVSVSGLKTAIKDASVASFREDADLRQAIKEETQTKLTEADTILSDLKGRAKQADVDKTEANVILNSSLKELHQLIGYVKAQQKGAAHDGSIASPTPVDTKQP